MNAPPVLPPTLPPTLPAAPRMEKIGYDKAKLHLQGTYTREQLFRLIGELERLAASL